MTNFDTLKESLAKALDAVKEKTGMAVNTGKMAIEVNRARADAHAARIELADLVMDKYVGGLITDEDILALCAEIEDADEQIADMMLALEDIKQETMDGLRSVSDTVTGAVNGIFKKENSGLTCPACGGRVSEDFLFCPGCGCELDTVDDIVDSADEMECCTGCCESCGGCGEEPVEYVDAEITAEGDN